MPPPDDDDAADTTDLLQSEDGASGWVPGPGDDDVLLHGGRYEREALLGRGAMGTVYLVRDRETGELVALKQLLRMDGKSILRLKREFRSLADVNHPNLIKVYELGHEDHGWFLTMEYLAGEELTSYLGLDDDDSLVSGIASAYAKAAAKNSARQQRVQACFTQLAQGILGLHRAGMLHRDLKPSNVMVADHRVVVLDFGLVRDLAPNAPALTEEGAIAGTPAYMAPEQVRAEALSEATDWYAFGVMLYQGLTGELPFDGGVMEVLSAKLEREPIPPRQLDPAIPEHLDRLCMALLARQPQARPSGEAVLRCLGVEPGSADASSTGNRGAFARPQGFPPARPSDVSAALAHQDSGETSLQTETQSQASAPAFFGRHAEVAALWRAMEQVDDGRAVVVHVRGVSGAGKSALVEQFLDQVEQQRTPVGATDALVLRSRCYEREAMPFKALDSVIDALSRHLAQLNDFEVSNLLPTDIGVLSQLFPTLERLRAVQQLLSVRPQRGNSSDRKRAETALRELFVRLTARSPVVIWIDDLQWGDLDSARILEGWLQRADGLPLLLVLSYRSDEMATSECLQRLLQESAGTRAEHPEHNIIKVEALGDAELAELCRDRLGADALRHGELIAHIVRECQGSPFLAAQLTALAHAKLAQGDQDVRALGISDLVARTTEMLPDAARHLLAVLAVAGRPIVPKLALRAAGIRRGGRDAVQHLRRLQLVRTREVAGDRLLEVYHDRVRESVSAMLTREQSLQVHGALLGALEYSGRAEPDWLHALALGAGQSAAAFRYGLAAAERANAALAFERAAALYASCLDLQDAQREGRRELHEKLASALGHAGRGSEAADAYLVAAELSEGDQVRSPLRRATSHLMRSGRFSEGEAMLQKLLEALDIEVPASRGRMVGGILWARMGRRFGVPSYTERAASELPPAMLERLDAIDCIRLETQSMAPLRSAYFLEQQLRLAIQAGEPLHVLKALCGVVANTLISGSVRNESQVDAQLLQAAQLAERIGTPEARATLCLVQAVAHWMLGRPQQVLEPAAEAAHIYASAGESRMDASYYQRLIAVSTRIGAFYELGDIRSFTRELLEALDEARATGNRAALLHLAANEAVYDHFAGRTAMSVTRLEQQRAELPQDEFGSFHALHLLALSTVARAGQRERVQGYIDEDLARYDRSTMRRVAYVSMLLDSGRLSLRADRAIARGGDPIKQLTGIVREADALARRRPAHVGIPFGHCMRARLAFAKGDRQAAAAELERAISHSTSALRIAQYRMGLGRLLPNEEGSRVYAEGERFLLDSGIADPVAVASDWFREFFHGS